MSVDYLSAINTKGSGLNVTQIVDSLVEAEVTPQRDNIQERIDTKNLEISTMAEVAVELKSLKTSVSAFANTTKLSTSSASSSTTISINDASTAKSFSSDVKITQLATSQTLEFSGFSSQSSSTGTGTISLDFGAWITDGTSTDNDSLFSSVSVSSSTSLGTPTAHSTLGGTISIATAVGGNQSSTVFTVVGTDMAGNSITENITGGASGATVSGSSVFKSVTSITPGSTVGSGSVTIGHTAASFGKNNSKTTQLITVSNGTNNTITGLASTLDAITGVTANVINKGDGTYSLVVRSTEGYANALKLSVSEAAGDEGLSTFDNVSDNGNHQTTAALDTSLIVDGITVKRSSNNITDLFDGYNIDINAVTTSTFRLSSSLDKSSTLETMKSFLEALNSSRSKLNEWTKIGNSTEEPGPLARNIGVNKIKDNLTKLVTGPIIGFGASNLYLSELGVRTSQSGTLTLNEATFNSQISSNSTVFDSIFNSMFSTSSDFLKAKMSIEGSTAKPTAGSYSYTSTNSTSATLAGSSMIAGTDSSGIDYFDSGSSGNTRGIRIIQSQIVPNATVYFGVSLIDQLSSYIDTTIATNGDLTKAQNTAGSLISDYNINLSNLDEKVDELTNRYTSQFSAMESAVTSFKSTGEYLTNMMDSWNKD